MESHGGTVCILLNERSQSDSNYTISWTRQKYGEDRKISGCQGLKKEGRMNSQSTEDCRVMKLL
jgi:hypothetical protein